MIMKPRVGSGPVLKYGIPTLSEATGLLKLTTKMVFIGPRCLWGQIYGFASLSPLANLTDVTLADEDTNSILTDNANTAIQGNVAMRIIQSGCQL